MKKNPALLIMILMAAAITLSPVASVRAQAIDVSGKWNMKVEISPGTTGSPVFVLKQQKDSVTGTYTGQLGEAPVKGSIKNKELRLEFKAGETTVVYLGTVDGKMIKGNATYAELGKRPFTGTKE